jgi:hypothetical protein
MSSKERHMSDQVKYGVYLARHASPVRKIREAFPDDWEYTVFTCILQIVLGGHIRRAMKMLPKNERRQ